MISNFRVSLLMEALRCFSWYNLTWKRKVWSWSLVLVAFTAASPPATATLAVPWMSSLNVQYLMKYMVKFRWNINECALRRTCTKGQNIFWPTDGTYLFLYFSRNLKALWLPKSSNWIKVFWPQRFTTACQIGIIEMFKDDRKTGFLRYLVYQD